MSGQDLAAQYDARPDWIGEASRAPSVASCPRSEDDSVADRLDQRICLGGVALAAPAWRRGTSSYPDDQHHVSRHSDVPARIVPAQVAARPER
jgi:hypothetical protein